MQKGLWEGRRILSEEWINEATKAQMATPNGECKFGYGYQLWLNPMGYQFNGAFGQYVVVMPKYDAVAVIFSGSTQLFAQGDLLQMLDRCFWGGAAGPLPAHPAGVEALQARLGSLRVSPPLDWEGLDTDPAAFDRLAQALDGQEYWLDANYGSIFPQTLQSVHGNYSPGASLLRFGRTPKGLALTIYEHQERNTLFLNRDGGFQDHRLALRDEAHLVSSRGLWQAGRKACGLFC